MDICSGILNLEGHLNRCIGLKVMAILLNGWIFPTGGVASGRICPAACAAGLFRVCQQHKKNAFENPTSFLCLKCMFIFRILVKPNFKKI